MLHTQKSAQKVLSAIGKGLISSYVIQNESMHIVAMCYVHAQLNPGCDGLQSTDIDTDSDVFPKLHTSKIQ